MWSMVFLLLNLGAYPLQKFLKLHVIYEIKSKCTLKSNYVGVILTLGILGIPICSVYL